MLSSTSIVILIGFINPLYDTHNVDLLLYHGIAVVSTHSGGAILLLPLSYLLDLSLDRAYRDVVLFSQSPKDIPSIVNRLLGDQNELLRIKENGKKFIEEKVTI